MDVFETIERSIAFIGDNPLEELDVYVPVEVESGANQR